MSDSVSPCLIVYSPQPGDPAVTSAATSRGAAMVRARRRARRRVGRRAGIWVLSDMSVDTAVTGVTEVTCGAFVTPSWYYTCVIQPGRRTDEHTLPSGTGSGRACGSPDRR